ncbi:MAG: Gfo/Idh/MocA family protein [Marmoricola sp.]
MPPLGWGILAPGKIARSFAEDLALLPDARVAAAGSRRWDTAEAFTRRYGGTPYGSYEQLVADPDVDVVYVASPHALHPEHVRLALDAGKPVLCEKPLALNAADATAMFAHAADRGLFLMEAMWTACHPLIRALLDRLASGAAGRPSQVVADLGFVVEAGPQDRLLDPAMGAGALLDMGIYPLTLAHLVLGAPTEQSAVAVVRDGIDLAIAVAARHGEATATSTASMLAATPRTGTVATDRGRFDLPRDFHHPARITWTPTQGETPGTPEDLEPVEPVVGRGYGNEALEVQRCLAAGRTTSALVPLEHTIALLQQMDALRAQIGVRYPGEPVTASQ